MSVDLDALIRRWKPDKQTRRLTQRGGAELMSVSDMPASRRLFSVPDTTVYIHNAAGTLPGEAAALLDGGLQWHCSVCLAEINSRHREP